MAVKMSRAKWKVRALRDLLRLHPSMVNKVLGGPVPSTGGAESQGTTPFSTRLPCSHSLGEPGPREQLPVSQERAVSPPGLSLRWEL